jgi:hypothetical protein
MPRCIVCRAYREAGRDCPRCHSDNSAWDRWQATRIEEKEGLEGLLAFCAPHFYLPFFITALALVFGLMGMVGFWEGILLPVRLLAVVFTVSLCLLAAFAGYDARHEIREQELLGLVRRGWSAVLGGVRLRAIIAPAVSMMLVLVAVFALIASPLAWGFAEWLLLDPEYLTQVKQLEQLERWGAGDDQAPEGEQTGSENPLREKLRQVLPLALMGMYVAFTTSFTYSASLQQALLYARKMNRTLPQPIFLRDELLAEVVRREAARVVGRPVTPMVIGGDEGPGQAEHGSERWTWDEMERTEDGGIRLKAIERAGNKVEESLTGERIERPVYVTYEVKANPWSLITKVARAKEPEKDKKK